jgi:predicted nucleic-acid-binding protein
MANAVEAQMRQGDCFIPTEAIAEMVYVLSKVYKIPKKEIVAAIMGVLSINGITTTDYGVISRGFEAYTETSLDFVDCLLAGYQSCGYEVFTFDKALIKYLQF